MNLFSKLFRSRDKPKDYLSVHWPFFYLVALLPGEMSMKWEIKSLQHGVDRICQCGLVLLRDRIIQSCWAFMERGSITITARNNIRDMYKCYHDEFGGNGDGEYFFDEMMNLPIDQDVPIVSPFDVGGGRSDRKN